MLIKRFSNIKAVSVACLLATLQAFADQIPVLERQGAMQGFLLLKTSNGDVIAVGDETTTVRGDQVRSHLIFHFRDGSIDDEISTFTQRSGFQLLSDHHIQKGPTFPKPLDISFELSAHKVTWREDHGGFARVKTENMDLPGDLANGMVSLIVENFRNNAEEMKVSYLSGSSKPRVVKLSVKPDGEDTFRVAGFSRRSKKFKIHIEIGGLAGLIAPLVGKQPDDAEVWVAQGEAPTVLKMVGPLYEGGPIWTMELAAPTWPDATQAKGPALGKSRPE